jgi:hypothetical protein
MPAAPERISDFVHFAQKMYEMFVQNLIGNFSQNY